MNLAIALKESVVCARERLTKRKILRNTFMSVGVLLALTRLMAAGSADGVLDLDKIPFGSPHSTFITFDPLGSILTLPSAITPSGAITGS